MAQAHLEHPEIPTALLVDRYLNRREHPSNIARSLGVPGSLVHSRLRSVGAYADPRAVTPFSDKGQPRGRVAAGNLVGPSPHLVLLDRLIKRSGRATAAIAKEVGMNVSHVNRLVQGERGSTPEMLGALMRVLKASAAQSDQIYAGFGFCPPSVARAGGWSAAMTAFCTVLGGMTDED